MDLINDFRDKNYVITLCKLINETSKEKINIMEICGGHTHSIMKFGIVNLLKDSINFVHGPGCPVCVMPQSRIDEAIKLANMPNTILCTLADMLRVPGNKTTLQKARAQGCDVRALYSPFDLISIAKENPDKNVIFFAIGFETTTPMTCVIVQKTIQENIKNLFFHVNHVTVPNTIRAILNDKEEVHIDAFLAPSHVSVITGSNIYKSLAKDYKKPFAVSGFEPVDILDSILNLVLQHQEKTYDVYNQYKRVVLHEGNLKAQELIKTYLKPTAFKWRGLGEIPDSGYDLRDEFDFLNAKKRFDCTVEIHKENKACICGEILKGRAKPFDCKVFGTACTPKNPIGSCMVSSEGACAAYFKYAKLENVSNNRSKNL